MDSRRILAVSAALAALGAGVGAVMGIVAISIVALIQREPGGIAAAATLFPQAAMFGAGVGAILGPAAAWTLMRHVPIWKAITGTAVGTTLGVVVGYWLAPLVGLGLLWPVGSGVAGFLGASVILRVRSRRSSRSN